MTKALINILNPSYERDFRMRPIDLIRDLTKLRRRRQGESPKSNRFNDQNRKSARASRFFAHFFAIPAQLRRDMTKF